MNATTNSTRSTAAAANFFAGALLMSLSVPTVGGELMKNLSPAPAQRKSTASSRLAAPPAYASAAATLSYDAKPQVKSRATTHVEQVVGELRSWMLLNENWDGEGAHRPIEHSLAEAEAFVRLLEGRTDRIPEPMLLASGSSSLYWNIDDLYADLEFLGNNRVAYFIKRNEDKHKGVLAFDAKQVPAVFQALILA